VTGGQELAFDTTTSGTHIVAVRYADTGARVYEVPVTVTAQQSDRDLPPTLRVSSSAATGTFAVVGDGLSGGDVAIDSGSGVARVVARTDSDISRLEAFTQSVSLPTEGQVELSIVDSDGRPAGEYTRVQLHLPRLPDGGLLWREGPDGDRIPLPVGESEWGTVNVTADQTIVDTVTDEDGVLTVHRNTDPSLLDRLQYQVQRLLAQLPGI
jgi:hypothetical protein